jgi:hypothetical protein
MKPMLGISLAAALLVGQPALARYDGTPGSTIVQPQDAADLFSKGYETCGAIKGKMELFLREANAHCQPVAEGRKIGIALVTSIPIFRSLKAKQGFFVAAIASAGYEARRAGLADFGTLYLVDGDTVKTFQSLAMPMERAAALQQQVHDGDITGDAFVAIVTEELRPTKVPH